MSDLTVAENIMMSDAAARSGLSFVPRAEMQNKAREALARLGMGTMNPATRVSQLSVAEMQLVEIARAIRQNARVLVLHEPNSALFETRERAIIRDRQVPTTRYHFEQRWTGVAAAQLGERYEIVEEGLSGRTTDIDDPTDPRLNGRQIVRPRSPAICRSINSTSANSYADPR